MSANRVSWGEPDRVVGSGGDFDPWLAGATALDVALAAHAGADALAARRARRLAELLASAGQDSPLYRRLLKGRNPASLRLEDLPVMRKTELVQRFDEWVADPRLRLDALRRFVADKDLIAQPFLGRYVVWESSGSSGEPGIFVQDPAAMAVYDALEALRRPLLRPLRRLLDPWCIGERIAFVGATGGHFASTVSIERLRRLNPALSGRLHGISFLQPVEAMVAQLNAFAPTVIATYPSAAVLLAQERTAGRLRVSLGELWTGGEDLSTAKRVLVQWAFDCPVTNSYGASEFLSLAFECEHGHLHLNSDWAILEAVDRRGNPVSPGHAGATTLLTNLANRVQPVIRYDLGDCVTQHARACACGSSLPVIEVRGRSDDTLRLGRASSGAVDVLPLALATVLEEEAGLFDFQLVQEGPCALLLRTGLRGIEADLALQRARHVLGAFLQTQGAAGVHIRCRSGEAALAGHTGKVQRVIAAQIRR
ncbi:phenylacetate--CoA ligase family protein [Variovorax soli]|uniref:Phenylacetate-coenzyme A ligase PaaK-like adenylate-forming protein n=1 Tax=Variovorax soli TaxID=376815 RepID=A0ABU1NKX4_9BURK|nr:phenylacetate--CoA ligase family protein [Variovorax soli]MDR6539123.1 phenylacetate-coenzyme A ligase PaaK-like adenylate-forming protein [Variovorax soli]